MFHKLISSFAQESECHLNIEHNRYQTETTVQNLYHIILHLQEMPQRLILVVMMNISQQAVHLYQLQCLNDNMFVRYLLWLTVRIYSRYNQIQNQYIARVQNQNI